jgi:hypothetical protein
MSAPSGSSTGNYILKRIPIGAKAKIFFQSYVVSAADQSVLSAAAKEDAQRYVYNGVLSFLGGISGLRGHHAAWTVTKMYYSAFYIARASLCRNGHLIFHVPKDGSSGHTQYELKAVAGQQAAVAGIASTHKLVATRFQQMGYPTFMRSLTIDGSDPLLWLMEQREFWQYRSGRFSDPDSPNTLDQIDIDRMQRFLAAYDEDNVGVYLSDPAHALIAIPFRLLTWALSVDPLRTATVVTEEDIAHLRKSCLVGKQQVTALSRYFQK